MDVDEFSDDGLADLTDNALQELEQRALHLTQAQPQQRNQAPPPAAFGENYGWEEEDDDLDTSEVINDVGAPITRSVASNALPQSPPQQNQQLRRHLLPPPNPKWNPTVDPANRRRPPTSIAPHVTNGVASHPSTLHTSVPGGQPQFTPLTPRPAPKDPAGVSQPVSTRSGDVSALQQRVRSLEAELNAARGEASIIRSNANKAQHDFDAQVARLKKLNAEQVSRHERTLEAAVAAEKSAQTELEFLQRDLREHRNRVRQQDALNGPSRNTATPRKASNAWAIADGFDALDVALSPSKRQGRAKTSGPVAPTFGEKTPSKGKRKRPAIESPIPALETHTEDIFMTEPGLDSRPSNQASQSIPVVAPTVAPFEFLQLILDHGSFHQEPPTFDILSRFCFPSDPAPVSFAAMIFEKFPLMGSPGRPMQLLVDFAEHVVAMWTRCVEEKFWEPIKYLVSLIAFTFDLHATTAAPLVMPSLVPTAQSTLFTVADARRRAPPDGQPSKVHDELHFLQGHIDTSKILPLLYITALACASTLSNDEYGPSYGAAMYWKLLSLDFVLLLLMPKQKLSDTMAMLELLAFSSLPGSIGPISEELEATVVARAVIERVSAKLIEHPRIAMTADQRRKLRLGALRTLVAFAMHPFGAMQLASHDNALPRLVTCLSLSLDDLYDQPVPPRILAPLPDTLVRAMQKLPESVACADLNRIISQSLLLIHTLVTDASTANAADISQKLSATHGGSQRYLLALGRLTFAEEDLVIEAGIDGEVVEAAHELLEMAVTPDEGQAVSEAFGA